MHRVRDLSSYAVDLQQKQLKYVRVRQKLTKIFSALNLLINFDILILTLSWCTVKAKMLMNDKLVRIRKEKRESSKRNQATIGDW